jgi:hypothetical protein
LQYSNDGGDFFRIKNIPESEAARKLLEGVGLDVYDTVSSIKQAARNLLPNLTNVRTLFKLY